MLRALGRLTIGYAAALALLSVAVPPRSATAEQTPRPKFKYVICTCGNYCEDDCPSPYICCTGT